MQSNYTSEAALVEPGLYLLPPWSPGAQIGIRASRGVPAHSVIACGNCHIAISDWATSSARGSRSLGILRKRDGRRRTYVQPQSYPVRREGKRSDGRAAIHNHVQATNTV